MLPTLTFGKLKFLPGAGSAILLSLHHARIPRKKTVGFQGGVICLVELSECSGNAMPRRAGLPIDATTPHRDENIQLSIVRGNRKGLFHLLPKNVRSKEFIETPAINPDARGPFADIYSRD